MKKIFLIILLIFMVSCGEDDKTISAIKFMKVNKHFKELSIDRLGEYPLFIAKRYVSKKTKEKDIIWENDKENKMVIATYKHLKTFFPYEIDEDGFHSVSFYDIKTCDTLENECASSVNVIFDFLDKSDLTPIFNKK